MATAQFILRIAAGLLLGVCLCARADGFAGIVTHVTDGDSLWVRPLAGGTALQVRLEGIDAPEICQRYGERSRAALASRTLHQRVQVTNRATDNYQRSLGRVSVRGEDVGRWMVSRGHAWSYRFRGDRGPYSRQEAQARSARLGLWSGPSPVQPRDFRKRNGSCKVP